MRASIKKFFTTDDLKEIRSKISLLTKDISIESTTESLALLRCVEDALKHNNFGHEIVIEKTVNIDGLLSDGPIAHIKWVVRERRTDD